MIRFLLTHKRLLLLGTLTSGLLLIALLGGPWLMIRNAARNRIYTDTQSIPHRKVGLVLGCGRGLRNGYPNPFFEYRIRAAVELYQADKIDYLLVSGDNHREGYDEPTDMKAALMERGVPADRIVCDYAGFRTLDSVVRAREVFGESEITIVSQAFHNARAIYLAQCHGIDAIGYNAADVDNVLGYQVQCRECLARVKTVLDVYILGAEPKFLGEKIIIGGQ